MARRRPGAPREVLHHLQCVQPFIDAHLPAPAGNCEEAAFAVLRPGFPLTSPMEPWTQDRAETRLTDRERSLTEREILRVLWTHQKRYLRRGEVQRMLNLLRRPTPARVGQILVGLDHENLVVRVPGAAQGNPEASFYALSPLGFEICQRLSLEPFPEPLLPAGGRGLGLPTSPRSGSPARKTRQCRGASPRSGPIAADRGAQRPWPMPLPSSPDGWPRRAPAASWRRFRSSSPRGLDAYLAPAGLGECRGLRGLIVDFYKASPGERSKRLQSAPLSPSMSCSRSRKSSPNLYYSRPAGSGPTHRRARDEEGARTPARLQDDARKHLGEAKEEGLLETWTYDPFRFRGALREDLYARTLTEPHAGFGLTAWATVLELADELVLCAPSRRAIRAR